MTYEFIVNDSEGLWGSIRADAKNPELAEEKCRRFLEQNEVEDGSLLPDFTVVRQLEGSPCDSPYP